MRKFFLLIALFFAVDHALACDLCGCSSGNYFIGPLPQFNRYFIGTRYTFRNYNSVLKGESAQFSKDHYQTVELLAGMRVGRKWQVLGFMPYNINYTNTDDGIKQDKGFGDITVLVNYNVINVMKLNRNSETASHQFWLGGGIKAPTGKFDVDTNELVHSANMQPGSGSFDFLVNASYLFQVNNWGLNSNINYKFNQAASNFKFGNRINVTTFVFRTFTVKETRLSPNMGLLYENLDPNRQDKIRISDTGGSSLLLGAGLETRYKNFALGFNGQLPLVQNLSDGQTRSKVRGMVQLSYMF